LFDLAFSQTGMTMRLCWQVLAAAMICSATSSVAGPANDGRAVEPHQVANETQRQELDTDLFALMSGRCSTLRIGGRDFACRSVAYFHSEQGRANFTIAVDDPSDASHIISFSGENGQRTRENLYELPIDRMLLKSKDRPKVDGLPVPSVELSAGICRQIGNFALRQVSSIYCNATGRSGQWYELRFESDGSPIVLRKVRESAPTIRQHP
jgi:hypothetical protein